MVSSLKPSTDSTKVAIDHPWLASADILHERSLDARACSSRLTAHARCACALPPLCRSRQGSSDPHGTPRRAPARKIQASMAARRRRAAPRRRAPYLHLRDNSRGADGRGVRGPLSANGLGSMPGAVVSATRRPATGPRHRSDAATGGAGPSWSPDQHPDQHLDQHQACADQHLDQRLAFLVSGPADQHRRSPGLLDKPTRGSQRPSQLICTLLLLNWLRSLFRSSLVSALLPAIAGPDRPWAILFARHRSRLLRHVVVAHSGQGAGVVVAHCARARPARVFDTRPAVALAAAAGNGGGWSGQPGRGSGQQGQTGLVVAGERRRGGESRSLGACSRGVGVTRGD